MNKFGQAFFQFVKLNIKSTAWFVVARPSLKKPAGVGGALYLDDGSLISSFGVRSTSTAPRQSDLN
jgi:hypothetical protein